MVGMTDDEQWTEGTETECDQCGEFRVCYFAPDPFISEVYPEDAPESRYWCRPCWNRRKDDI